MGKKFFFIGLYANMWENELETMVFCLTLLVSHIVASVFWHTLLYIVTSVHRGLQAFIYAHLS